MPPGQAEALSRSLRSQRLKWAWFLAIPFLFFSHATPKTLLAGAALSLLGLLLRGLAAGSILKDQTLATTGIYGRVRHPLYMGSSLIGMGLSLASGVWWIPLFVLLLFLWVYGLAIRAEETRLELQFGAEYLTYRNRVRAFFPDLGSPKEGAVAGAFRSYLYLRNKEWQAALGVAAALLLIWLKTVI
jgi:hypothetical protein